MPRFPLFNSQYDPMDPYGQGGVPDQGPGLPDLGPLPPEPDFNNEWDQAQRDAQQMYGQAEPMGYGDRLATALAAALQQPPVPGQAGGNFLRGLAGGYAAQRIANRKQMDEHRTRLSTGARAMAVQRWEKARQARADAEAKQQELRDKATMKDYEDQQNLKKPGNQPVNVKGPLGEQQPITMEQWYRREGQDWRDVHGVPGGSSSVQLTPEARALYAGMLLNGIQPSVGRDANTRNEIANLAGRMAPGADIAANKAQLAANQANLSALTKNQSAYRTFKNTALKNLEILKNKAGKIADTGSPLFNTPLRALNSRVLGSQEMAAYDMARRVVIPEFARLVAQPNLTGQLTDTARHEIESVAGLGDGATLAQILSAADVLVQDAANRGSAIEAEIAGIKESLTGQLRGEFGQPGTSGGASQKQVWGRDANGKPVRIQ